MSLKLIWMVVITATAALAAGDSIAGTLKNTLMLNGIHLNGIHLNGIHLNGSSEHGSQVLTDEQKPDGTNALQVERIELPPSK